MRVTCLTSMLCLLIVLPAAGADGVESEIRAAVEASYARIRSELVDPRDTISEQGAPQFWSSGGLMLTIEAGDRGTAYDSFDVYPKHITVIELSETAAAALYYAEGSMAPKGSPPVARYLARVLEIFVKEDGVWKQRAGHWSPLTGGGGTTRSSE